MTKYLYSLYFDCGRQGALEGLFVEDEEVIQQAFGYEVYFGEALGKHSEIYGTFEQGDVSKMNVSPEAVEEVSKILGDTWSGYNPMEFLPDEFYDKINNTSENKNKEEN